VRTTFLRAVYEPWLSATLTLMALVLGAALTAAFLLSNLALRPLEEISLQLDYWTAASEAAGEDEKKARPRRIRRRASPTRSRSSASACAMWKRFFPR
jgi:hypothetical protein